MRRKVPWPKLITIPWGNTPCAQKCSDFQSKMHCSFKLLIRLTLQISLSQFSIGFLLTPALMRRTDNRKLHKLWRSGKNYFDRSKKLGGAVCVVDEAEIERGRGRKNVNSLRKPEASCTYFFLRNGNMCTTYVLQFFYVVLFSLKKINTNKET